MKNHLEKKKAVPAAIKDSRKIGVSLADKKKLKTKTIAGKTGPQHKKKEAAGAKAKPSKSHVLPAAVKKQPVNRRTTAKASGPSKEKESPPVKTKPSKSPALSAAAKKQTGKSKPVAKAAGHGERKSAPAVKEKNFDTKTISSEKSRRPEQKDVIVVQKIQTQSIIVSSVGLGKRYKCYKCGIKFFDLAKPQPLCPSCGANQVDGMIKAARKRRGKHRSAYVAKTEPLNIAPGETEDLHEVVDELDSEYVLDVEDIVLEEHEDTEDKD